MCVSHSLSATVPPLNTANKNQNSNQQLPLVEGGEGGPSVGESAPRGGSGTFAGTSNIAGVSHLSSATTPLVNTTHNNRNLNQMLPVTEGGEAGQSVGVDAARRSSKTNTGTVDNAPINCLVSGAKKIETNQSPASDPMVDYEVAPPRVK